MNGATTKPKTWLNTEFELKFHLFINLSICMCNRTGFKVNRAVYEYAVATQP